MALFRSASFGLLRPAFAITLVLAAAGVRLSSTTRTQFQTIHSFNGPSEGERPTSLIQAADGKLYGLTAGGGSYGQGTFFTMTPEGTVTVLHMFSAVLESVVYPHDLVQGSDGSFYGIGSSSIFVVTPLSPAVKIVYTFPENLRAYPFNLLQGPDNALYGTTLTSNPTFFGGGSVFRVTPAGLFTALRSFPLATDIPFGLTLGSDGNLYGTTTPGEMSTVGGPTAYRMTLTGDVTTLHLFTNGDDPFNLIEGADKNFYGFSCCSGPFNNGHVIRMTPGGVVTLVRPRRDFEAGLETTFFRGGDGHLYGTFVKSFSNASPYSEVSSIFKMTLDGTTTILHAFPRTNGTYSMALTQATDGALYGTVNPGGTSGVGAAFRLNVTVTQTPLGDFDGDGKADVAVFRPETGVWYLLQSHTGFGTYLAESWGLPTDVPVPGDYDGDGKIDPAVYRPSTGQWFLLTSSSDYTSFVVEPWGLAMDTPVPGDYDGDGRTDLAMYRPSTGVWYLKFSRTNYQTSVAYQWGLSSDIAVPADFDGDGATDIGIYRPSTGQWYVLTSSTNFASVLAVPTWGTTTDIAVPGDYDGDGKADPAVFRPSTGQWYVLMSSTNFTTYLAPVPMWGAASDIAVPGDYDGDGKFDPAVYRPSTGVWYILQSATNYTTYVAQEWGFTTDMPINHR